MAVIYISEETKDQLPQRSKHDLYRTPQSVVDKIACRFALPDAVKILDIGAGDGRWGVTFARVAKNPLCLIGVDINPLEQPAQPEYFTFWLTIDYSLPLEVALMPVKGFDLAVGNPPFNRAEAMIYNAWSQLSPGGQIIFLLPVELWCGINRYKTLWRDLPPKEVCAVVNRIPFTGGGNPSNNAIYIWQKDQQGRPVGRPNETRATQLMF